MFVSSVFSILSGMRAGNGSSDVGSVSSHLCDKFLNTPLSFLTCEVATIVSVLSLVVTVWVVQSCTFIECLLRTVQSETVYLVG